VNALHVTLEHTRIPIISRLASSATLEPRLQLAAHLARNALLVNTPTLAPSICVHHVSLARSVWLVQLHALLVPLAPSLASQALAAAHLARLAIMRLVVPFSAARAQLVKSPTRLLLGATRAAMDRLHLQATLLVTTATLANTPTHPQISYVRIALLAHTHRQLVRDLVILAPRVPTRQALALFNARFVFLGLSAQLLAVILPQFVSSVPLELLQGNLGRTRQKRALLALARSTRRKMVHLLVPPAPLA
jgi:hypothetical protein